MSLLLPPVVPCILSGLLGCLLTLVVLRTGSTRARQAGNTRAVRVQGALIILSLADRLDGIITVLNSEDPNGSTLRNLQAALQAFADNSTWDGLCKAVSDMTAFTGGPLMDLWPEESAEIFTENPDTMSPKDWDYLLLECHSAAECMVELLTKAAAEFEGDTTRTVVTAESSGIAEFGGDTTQAVVTAESSASAATYKSVEVLYATDRLVTVEGQYIGMRSSRGKLHYGIATVSVPVDRAKGSMERPSAGQDAQAGKHLGILSVDTTWRDDICPLLDKVRGGKGTLLFVHGFNVTHTDALLRGAQLKYDLQFDGSLLCYSWGSKGKISHYRTDERTIGETESNLADFIKELLTTVDLSQGLHIIAHSMGTRAVVKAVGLLVNKKVQLKGLKTVTLVAADVSLSDFTRMMERVESNVKVDPPAFAVYSSMHDRALSVSGLIHLGETRLGNSWSLLTEGRTCFNQDFVDATGLDPSILGHSYYGDVPKVIEDIQHLLLHKRAAERSLVWVLSWKGERKQNLHAFRGWEKTKLKTLIDKLVESKRADRPA